MKKLLTSKEVEQEFGFSRSSLLRYEGEGALTNVYRTPGGQRRYTPEQIKGLNSNNGMVEKQSRIDLYREYGTTGIQRWSGRIYEERMRELRGREGRIRYREMRQNDPVIAAVMFGIVNALKQPSVRVVPATDKPADKRAAEFVEESLHDMSWSWIDTLDMILNEMFEQGFAIPEIVYKRRKRGDSKYDDNRISWRKWAPRPAESLAEGQEWIYDAHGGIHGINQLPEVWAGPSPALVGPIPKAPAQTSEGRGNVFSIPIQKLLHFRTTLHPANNPEGASLLRPMFLPYWYSQNLAEIEGIGAERDLAGIPVVYLGRGTSLGDDPNSDFSLSKELVENLRNDVQAGVVIPHPKLGTAQDGEGVLLELLSTGGRRQWDLNQIIERYDKRKALSVLAQFIMLGMSNMGSYALSRTQGDLFVLAVQAFLDVISQVINRHGLTRLIDLNAFPGMSDYPQLAFSPVGVPDLGELSEFVNKLVDKQVLTPDAELERHLRQVSGLPQAQVAETEEPTDKKMPLEDAAMMVRRIAMAIKPLSDLGALEQEEAKQWLGPAIEEMRQALGYAPDLEGMAEAQPVAEKILRKSWPLDPFEATKNYIDLLYKRAGVHRGEAYPAMVCPLCDKSGVTVYDDHNGLAICQHCHKTFDPSFFLVKHLGGQHDQQSHAGGRGGPQVWTGERQAGKATISKLKTGEIGEKIATKALSDMFGAEFGTLNVNVNNAPIDVMGDHTAVEVKTGLATNSRSAQRWRATIGEPGKAEKAALKKMNPEEKRAHNQWKSEQILKRKNEMLAELSQELGHELRPMTVGIILDKSGKRGDVFLFDGFHLRLTWRANATSANYIGTYEP